MIKEINVVKRKNVIDFYLDLINKGVKLNRQQKYLLKELSKSVNDNKQSQ
jgi:hypothetical protein